VCVRRVSLIFEIFFLVYIYEERDFFFFIFCNFELFSVVQASLVVIQRAGQSVNRKRSRRDRYRSDITLFSRDIREMSSRRKKVEKRFSVNRRSSQRRAVEDLDKLWKGVHEEMRKKMKRRGRHDDNDSIEDEDEAPRTPEKPLDFLTARISASSPLADKRVLMLESRVLDEVEKNRRVRAECIQRESEMLKELELARKNATKELETARRMYEDKLRIESIRSEKRKEAALRSAEEKRKSDLALLRHELTEQMNRAIQETKQNMIMKTLLRRMSSVPESPVVVRGISTSPRGGSRLPTTKFERDTLKTWEQVVRRMLRSTITNNRSLYGAKIGSHEDGDFHEAFQAFDRDGNGRISLSELADAFRRLDLGLSEKQISIILKHADLDHNGTSLSLSLFECGERSLLTNPPNHNRHNIV
jgi:hypothetical protein